jgi:NitT/TauT family transport system substrate-binding protein
MFDVLFTVDPWVTIAEAEIGARVLVPNPRVRYIVDPFPFGAAAVSKEFLRKSPEDVARIYRALERAVRHIEKDPLRGKSTLPSYTRITDENLALKTATYLPFTLDDHPDVKAIQELADMMLEHGLLRKRMDTNAVFLEYDQLRIQ